jgi:hypothetical protein
MCQRTVETLIGKLMTDEAFRRRFAADRQAVLTELVACGFVVNACEREALGTLDLAALGRWAEEIDPRLQKADLSGDLQ